VDSLQPFSLSNIAICAPGIARAAIAPSGAAASMAFQCTGAERDSEKG